MPYYLVSQGDCILSISSTAGFLWETIWNDPKNAALKASRKDPNVLYPGDLVFIPEKRIKQESKPVDALHSFVKKADSAKLRLQLLDRNHKPRPNLKYILIVDGKSSAGTSDGNGWIIESMPPKAKNAELTVEDQGVQEKYRMALGGVDPVTEISGVKQRLKNLGYSLGDGSQGLEQALRAFQQKYGLSVTGNADDATSEKLKSIHGC